MKYLVLLALLSVAFASPTPVSKTNTQTKTDEVDEVKTEQVNQVKEEIPVSQMKEEVVPMSQANIRNLDDFVILIPASQLRNLINFEGQPKTIINSEERHTPSYGYGASSLRTDGETSTDEVPATPFQFPTPSILSPFTSLFPSLSLAASPLSMTPLTSSASKA